MLPRDPSDVACLTVCCQVAFNFSAGSRGVKKREGGDWSALDNLPIGRRGSSLHLLILEWDRKRLDDHPLKCGGKQQQLIVFYLYSGYERGHRIHLLFAYMCMIHLARQLHVFVLGIA